MDVYCSSLPLPYCPRLCRWRKGGRRRAFCQGSQTRSVTELVETLISVPCSNYEMFPPTLQLLLYRWNNLPLTIPPCLLCSCWGGWAPGGWLEDMNETLVVWLRLASWLSVSYTRYNIQLLLLTGWKCVYIIVIHSYSTVEVYKKPLPVPSRKWAKFFKFCV